MSYSNTPEALVRRFKTRNPFEIAEGLEIRVHFLNRKESGLPGLTCLVGNRPSIYINQAYFDSIQRNDPTYTDEMMEDDILQVGAHELGHAVKHRQQLKQAPIMEYEIFNVRTLMESAANQFAAGIRIDTAELVESFNAHYNLLQIASALHVNINLLIYKLHQLSAEEGFVFNQLPYIPKDNFMGSIHGSGSSEWE